MYYLNIKQSLYTELVDTGNDFKTKTSSSSDVLFPATKHFMNTFNNLRGYLNIIKDKTHFIYTL